MKFFRVLISVATVFVLLFSGYTNSVFASPSLTNKKYSEEYEEYISKNEDYVNENKVIIEEENILTPIFQKNMITPYAIVPEDGATKIIHYTYSGLGVIDTPDDSISGILQTIKDIGMEVAGVFVSTVQGVVLGATDLLISQIAFDKYTTAKTFKSYRYAGKEVQVYTGSSWRKYYDARARETYKHYFATFVTKDNFTRTDTEDYTADKGYSPVKVEPSKNFNNESELRYRAWYNWYMGSGYRYPEYW